MIRLINAAFAVIIVASGISAGGTFGLAVCVLGLWYLYAAV
jgi:hypothetical protein